jgi:hypothetical protein
MRIQANPEISEPYTKKVRKRIVLARVAKRMQQRKIIEKRCEGRKVVQWEVTCDTGRKYYVCAVSRENALWHACRLKIPEDSILSIEIYNDPLR